MIKHFLSIFSFLSLFSISGCYEPVEGCLDIDAVNYNVLSDDPCGDCCSFPTLRLGLQHQVEWPKDSVSMLYDVFYPNINTAVTTDSFLLERARFFISNVRLVLEGGTEVDVEEDFELTFVTGDIRVVKDNFAKLDRDIFEFRTLGTVKTEGVFNEIRFTLGLEEFLLQNEIASGLPTGHPLDTSSDTIIYETGTGIIPNLLIVRQDTLLSNNSLTFQFFDPLPVSLPLEPSLVVQKGFNIKITLKTNYMDWFAGVDFKNDSYQTVQQKINDNLPYVFSVTEIKLE